MKHRDIQRDGDGEKEAIGTSFVSTLQILSDLGQQIAVNCWDMGNRV